MLKSAYQKWHDVNVELPICDGNVLVTNDPECEHDLGICLYDGIGFLFANIYRPVKYWAYMEIIQRKYGKVK